MRGAHPLTQGQSSTKNRRRPRGQALGATLCLCLMLGGCSGQMPVTRTGFYLDTVVEITVYGEGNGVSSAQDAADGAMELVGRYDRLFSPEGEGSDVAKINSAGGKPVAVEAETADLIRRACRYSELTEGAFDLTVAPETSLWDFRGESHAVPDAEVLSRAAALVDWRAVQVDGQTVTLRGEGRAIDLGGVAKGYIADRVREYLAGEGVSRALINLGGNVYAMGDKYGGDWTIGIRDPAAALAGEEALVAAVKVKDRSVVTSGVYERGFEIEGVLYHHILDPHTGRPVNNGLSSVTIVSADSALSDALSTACFVLGEERGLALAETLEGVEALFIRADGGMTATRGLVFEKAG